MMMFFMVSSVGVNIQAGAQTVCNGTATYVFQPKLTNNPRDVQIGESINYSSCLPQMRTGSQTDVVQVTTDFTCNQLLAQRPGAQAIDWSDGNSTVLNTTDVTTAVLGQYVITQVGSVYAGQFQNQSAVAVLTLTNLGTTDFATACADSGVSAVSGPIVLTITSP